MSNNLNFICQVFNSIHLIAHWATRWRMSARHFWGTIFLEILQKTTQLIIDSNAMFSEPKRPKRWKIAHFVMTVCGFIINMLRYCDKWTNDASFNRHKFLFATTNHLSVTIDQLPRKTSSWQLSQMLKKHWWMMLQTQIAHKYLAVFFICSVTAKKLKVVVWVYYLVVNCCVLPQQGTVIYQV